MSECLETIPRLSPCWPPQDHSKLQTVWPEKIPDFWGDYLWRHGPGVALGQPVPIRTGHRVGWVRARPFMRPSILWITRVAHGVAGVGSFGCLAPCMSRVAGSQPLWACSFQRSSDHPLWVSIGFSNYCVHNFNQRYSGFFRSFWAALYFLILIFCTEWCIFCTECVYGDARYNKDQESF